MKIKSVTKLEETIRTARKVRAARKTEILVCAGTGCIANGGMEVAEELDSLIKAKRLKTRLHLFTKKTGCHGFCEKGPLVVIQPQGVFYQGVKPKHAKEIIEKTILNGEIIQKLLYKDPNTKKRIERYKEIPFYSKQHRIALRNIGKIDPADIEDYFAEGGYKALAKALKKMTPNEIIEEVSTSGIRGCGGGGFPTGKKWKTCATAEDTPKYILCNADEGDPGAFMDRSICEGDPHAIIEGMVIGGKAVGANEGVIYVRDEYPLAVKHLNIAIEQARERGLLGDNILGNGFSFDIRIARGGGAFVCGESSALMKSVAGEVGEPRAKYIHSVIKGLYDKPTVLNNVETWANIPYIISTGAKKFSRLGTDRSKGTKAFSLVGKVKNTGLVEVPMGSTLRQIIFDVGGGIINDRPFKAVQTGGPSGGCLPESFLDIPVDFDSLTDAGSMMGSGGMIVMDDHTCIVDVAKYFVKFLTEESCGKCTPCREGLVQLLHILNGICEGKGKNSDIEKIKTLSEGIISGSLCALGKSAPNPVLSTIRYFEDEYKAHIKNKKCPAGVCRNLTTFKISEENCTGCTLCKKACPVECISGKKKKTHIIDQKACTKCGACRTVCRFDAVDTV